MKIEDLIEARNKVFKSIREYEEYGDRDNLKDEIMSIFDNLIIKESTKSDLCFPPGVRTLEVKGTEIKVPGFIDDDLTPKYRGI